MSLPFQGPLKNHGGKIGVVTSRFNDEVTFKLERGALEWLRTLYETTSIVAVRVPGAFEIPLAAQVLLESGCDGVVCLGAVIRGDTAHFDYVCSAVERGCTELQLRTNKPVGFGILTTDTDEQAMDRAGGAHGNKGQEAAQVVVEMLNLKKSFAGF